MLIISEKGGIKVDLLEKVEAALNQLVANNQLETEVTLSFADLRGIRRDILVAEYQNKLAGENLRAGLDFGKQLKG